MSINLGDDGTMDTVVFCSECGQEYRFNFDREMDIPRDDIGTYKVGNDRYRSEEQANAALYDLFITDCIEQITDEHVCGSDDLE